VVPLTIAFLFTSHTAAAETQRRTMEMACSLLGGGVGSARVRASSNKCVNFCEFSARSRS
jgi:hypothetical protein